MTFDSTHYAIKIEKRMKDAELKGVIIPTPREVSASCGLSLKFLEEDKPGIIGLLEEADRERVTLYLIDRRESTYQAEKLEW
ncbi:MAG: DUF3343 domain-containing protein [Clostridia bacterium]|nr:DUF3343 domain-containing protein [Clostridia bacterium]